jgi:thiol:disulfide interchange protein DsbC
MKLLAQMCAAVLAAAVCSIAPAQTPTETTPAKAEAKKDGRTIEDGIRKKIEARLGAKPSSVMRMPFGLWEVVIGSDIFYVDANVNYLVVGRAIDARTKEDLTAKRRDEILMVDYKSLPLDLAIKNVRGDGSRQFVTFEDPNCPYCRKLHRDLASMNNVTIYTFLYPILSQDSFEKSKAIWCAPDRAAAWNGLMIEGKAPPAAAADCKHPLQQTLALGQKLDVTGTPTMVFPDGRRLPGAVSVEEIEKMLAQAAKTATAAAAR